MNTTDIEQSAMRQKMIDGQLLPNNVTDNSVVEAISKVNRQVFVPKSRNGVAYLDKNIQISDDRYLMEPMTFAKLLNAGEIKYDDLILDIAPGTGYSSAVLSNLVEAVVAIEEDDTLAKLATENLASENCDNVAVINGAHKLGLAKQGPYDLILINGMVDEIPEELLKQLTKNGRLLCILNQQGIGRAVLVTYINAVMGVRILFDASAAKLNGFAKTKEFQF